MTIEQNENYTRLTAEQGKVLKSGEMYVHSVCTTTPNAWEEWTEEEMEEWLKNHPPQEQEQEIE